MVTGLSNELRAYYNSVAEVLPCEGAARKKYLHELEERLCELQLEQSAANRETAREHFGTPEEIAESWMENLSACDAKRRIASSRRIRAMLAGCGVFAIGGLALFGGFYLKYQKMERESPLVEVLIVYPDSASEGDILRFTANDLGVPLEDIIRQRAEQKNLTLMEYLQIIADKDDMTLEDFIEKYDLDFDELNDEKE